MHFTDLKAWQKALLLVEDIYRISQKFPPDERFGLTSQIRRASASVVANIAEGFGRFTYDDKANRYTIARGECTEVQAFLYIARQLQFVDPKEIKPALILAEEVQKILSGLIHSCKKKSNS